MTAEERLHRGSRAKEVLENEEFVRAFSAIEEELTTAWKTSPQRDSTAREHLFLCLTLLSKVQATIITTMETGRLAAEELKFHKSMAEKAKAFLGMS